MSPLNSIAPEAKAKEQEMKLFDLSNIAGWKDVKFQEAECHVPSAQGADAGQSFQFL